MELSLEIEQKRRELNTAIKEYRDRGVNLATADKEYRRALNVKLLELRDNDQPVTIVVDLARGDAEVAQKRYDKAIAEVLYRSALERIQATKLELKLLLSQFELEWREAS